jgi:hypothetical protein
MADMNLKTGNQKSNLTAVPQGTAARQPASSAAPLQVKEYPYELNN